MLHLVLCIKKYIFFLLFTGLTNWTDSSPKVEAMPSDKVYN